MSPTPDLRDDWIPVDACTLPTAEQPLRRAEFDALFAESLTSVDSLSSSRVRLTLAGGVEVASRARALADLETGCCSFFTFEVIEHADHVLVEISVPDARADVLVALTARAEQVRSVT